MFNEENSHFITTLIKIFLKLPILGILKNFTKSKSKEKI